MAQAVDSTKLSTEEDDRAHNHLQPAYDPQVYSSDTSPRLSLSVPIPKNQTYVRPQHPKVFCDKCNIKPEGFRGPHELRRHMENYHAPFRTVWVCVDRSPDNKFLSKCKACNEGKQYGAYYNAAAHLRRIHFVQKKSKPRGRGRGGDGGGDNPPMEVLKTWIQDLSVPNDPQTQRSYETQNYPYHLENDTMGAAAAAAAGNQLEMNSLEGIDEQETGISNTALDLQTKVPDHVEFAPNAEAQASQGDAVIIGYMGGLNHPNLAMAAGEEPLLEESDKSADEDASKLLGTAASGGETGTSPRDHGYDPAGKKNPEAPHRETPNRVDPFVQEVTEKRREGAKVVTSVFACARCRSLKRKVSVLAGSGFSTVTNTCLVYTYRARRSYSNPTVTHLINGAMEQPSS